jgi:hypothetical protein
LSWPRIGGQPPQGKFAHSPCKQNKHIRPPRSHRHSCSLSHWLKCEHILYSSYFQNWKFLNSAMWTHWVLNWFFLSTQFLQFFWIFSHKNSLKNQYLPYLSSENCEINSVKSDSSRAFQQHQESPQISIIFLVFHLYWKNGSIINSFQTVTPNNLKPSQCTLTHEELSNTKNATWSRVVSETSPWQNKTNYLAS